jgi:transposase
MRGADTFTESLFTLKKLDDVVPANHPLRVIRTMVNKALAEMGELFARMYKDDITGGRPSLAPEKLLRALLLQVLYSIRSERLVDAGLITASQRCMAHGGRFMFPVLVAQVLPFAQFSTLFVRNP